MSNKLVCGLIYEENEAIVTGTPDLTLISSDRHHVNNIGQLVVF